MRTLFTGIIIGVAIASLAWLVADDIEKRFDRMSEKIERHEQAITLLIRLSTANQ